MATKILIGDCIEQMRTLPDRSVHCCVTSPPYWGLRDYGVAGQIGLEKTPKEYVTKLVAVFQEVKRVLRDDGTLWLNLGDSYATTGDVGVGGSEKQNSNRGSVKYHGDILPDVRSKNLVGIPWRVAFALQADGWILRQDIIWAKPSPMPESVTDRCTKAHEYIFLLVKSSKYYYNQDAIMEPAVTGWKSMTFIPSEKDKLGGTRTAQGGCSSNNRTDQPNYTRNKRSVWTVASQPYADAHFATFPPKLIEPCILAGCPKGGTVLDPFGGSGTTGKVTNELMNRDCILIELNPKYWDMAKTRTKRQGLLW